MLKPFRIRNLYFSSPDLADCSGVVQLSSQQYDQEIQSAPEAAYLYLDEDDGETVTVGSSFELEQRLQEPSQRVSSWRVQAGGDTSSLLHIFDIKQSARAASAWRKYAICYFPPPAPRLTQIPAPAQSRCKQDDYDFLIGKVQTLELEVRLLKEAFKAHAISLPARSREPQQSIFTAAYKNSDLSALPVPSSSLGAPIANGQGHQPDHQGHSHHKVAFNGLHPPNLGAAGVAGVPVTASSKNHDDKPSPLFATPHVPEDFCAWFDRQEHAASPIPGIEPMVREQSEPQAREPSEPKVRGPSEPKVREPSEPIMSETLRRWRSLHREVLRQRRRDINPRPIITLDECSVLDLPDQPRKESPAVDLVAGPSVPPKEVETATVSTASSIASPSESASKSLLDLEPEAEIARFPTIFQLEKEGLKSAKSKAIPPHDLPSSNISLARAKTVTSSNPAARLLKPFDPDAEALGDLARRSPLPRRSDSERHRRRPYAEQFSGSGRTLWEEFERHEPPQVSSGAAKLVSKPEAQPQRLVPPPPTPSVTRSQSLKQRQPTDEQPPRRLAPMRSAVDLSGTQRINQERMALDQLRNGSAAASSTPRLIQPQATEALQKRLKRVHSCAQSLREMGFKPASRLAVYAEACDGNVGRAIVMAEEDEKATKQTAKLGEAMTTKMLECVKHFKAMGYGTQYDEEQLKKFAWDADGDVALAVEAMQAPTRRDLDEWRQTWREMEGWRHSWGAEAREQGVDMGMGMPGSFP